MAKVIPPLALYLFIVVKALTEYIICIFSQVHSFSFWQFVKKLTPIRNNLMKNIPEVTDSGNTMGFVITDTGNTQKYMEIQDKSNNEMHH